MPCDFATFGSWLLALGLPLFAIAKLSLHELPVVCPQRRGCSSELVNAFGVGLRHLACGFLALNFDFLLFALTVGLRFLRLTFSFWVHGCWLLALGFGLLGLAFGSWNLAFSV